MATRPIAPQPPPFPTEKQTVRLSNDGGIVIKDGYLSYTLNPLWVDSEDKDLNNLNVTDKNRSHIHSMLKELHSMLMTHFGFSTDDGILIRATYDSKGTMRHTAKERWEKLLTFTTFDKLWFADKEFEKSFIALDTTKILGTLFCSMGAIEMVFRGHPSNDVLSRFPTNDESRFAKPVCVLASCTRPEWEMYYKRLFKGEPWGIEMPPPTNRDNGARDSSDTDHVTVVYFPEDGPSKTMRESEKLALLWSCYKRSLIKRSRSYGAGTRYYIRDNDSVLIHNLKLDSASTDDNMDEGEDVLSSLKRWNCVTIDESPPLEVKLLKDRGPETTSYVFRSKPRMRLHPNFCGHPIYLDAGVVGDESNNVNDYVYSMKRKGEGMRSLSYGVTIPEESFDLSKLASGMMFVPIYSMVQDSPLESCYYDNSARLLLHSNKTNDNPNDKKQSVEELDALVRNMLPYLDVYKSDETSRPFMYPVESSETATLLLCQVTYAYVDWKDGWNRVISNANTKESSLFLVKGDILVVVDSLGVTFYVTKGSWDKTPSDFYGDHRPLLGGDTYLNDWLGFMDRYNDANGSEKTNKSRETKASAFKNIYNPISTASSKVLKGKFMDLIKKIPNDRVTPKTLFEHSVQEWAYSVEPVRRNCELRSRNPFSLFSSECTKSVPEVFFELGGVKPLPILEYEMLASKSLANAISPMFDYDDKHRYVGLQVACAQPPDEREDSEEVTPMSVDSSSVVIARGWGATPLAFTPNSDTDLLWGNVDHAKRTSVAFDMLHKVYTDRQKHILKSVWRTLWRLRGLFCSASKKRAYESYFFPWSTVTIKPMDLGLYHEALKSSLTKDSGLFMGEFDDVTKNLTVYVENDDRIVYGDEYYDAILSSAWSHLSLATHLELSSLLGGMSYAMPGLQTFKSINFASSLMRAMNNTECEDFTLMKDQYNAVDNPISLSTLDQIVSYAGLTTNDFTAGPLYRALNPNNSRTFPYPQRMLCEPIKRVPTVLSHELAKLEEDAMNTNNNNNSMDLFAPATRSRDSMRSLLKVLRRSFVFTHVPVSSLGGYDLMCIGSVKSGKGDMASELKRLDAILRASDEEARITKAAPVVAPKRRAKIAKKAAFNLPSTSSTSSTSSSTSLVSKNIGSALQEKRANSEKDSKRLIDAYKQHRYFNVMDYV